MSNIIQFFNPGKRLGEVVALPYQGDSFTAADGTVWKSVNASLLAYSSTYAGLLTDAPEMVTAATAIGGPFAGGTWQNFGLNKPIVGASAGGSTWLTVAFSTATPDYYFTSTNAGTSWTKRTPPVAAKNWMPLWDGTNFVLYANGTGATGVQESTDGITWTARTAISITTLADLVFANSLYVAWPSSGTTLATSPDRTTWTTRACTTTSAGNSSPGLGNITWNAGAGLWISSTSTAGQYQTSPDAATWTNRTTFNDIPGLFSANNISFASDAVTTIVVGAGGSYAYSTNGTSWTADFISSSLNNTTTPSASFYDGTRFVVEYNGIVFYSTSGTGSWSRATRGNMPTGGNRLKTPTGYATKSSQTCINQADVSSSSSTNIIYPTSSGDAVIASYARIL